MAKLNTRFSVGRHIAIAPNRQTERSNRSSRLMFVGRDRVLRNDNAVKALPLEAQSKSTGFTFPLSR